MGQQNEWSVRLDDLPPFHVWANQQTLPVNAAAQQSRQAEKLTFTYALC